MSAPGWPLDAPAFADAAARRAALSGPVAVVTGASRGLGAGLAAHFAMAGLRLGLCARHRPELAPSTRPRGHDGVVEPAVPPLTAALDVRDAGALAAFADEVVARFGRIDLWVNNAGVLEPMGPLALAEPAAMADHIAVNLGGVAAGSAAFARHVRARPGPGVLVNVSSGAARTPYEGWALYCATKAAVEQLTEVVAREERAHGLRAHAVAPGVVDTDMQAAIRATDPATFPAVERFRRLGAEGAFSSPRWVADHLLDLAFGAHGVEVVVLRVPTEAGGGAPRRGR